MTKKSRDRRIARRATTSEVKANARKYPTVAEEVFDIRAMRKQFGLISLSNQLFGVPNLI